MVNYNGTLLGDQEGIISAFNRGMHYGDAVFETIKLTGGKILFWEDHYFRLMASMRILRLEIPMHFTPEFLEAEIFKTKNSEDNKTTAFSVKLLVCRKAGGKYTPITNDIDYLISAEAMDNTFYTADDGPYIIELFKDHYVNSGLLSTLKTNNKIVNVLGSIFAKENDYDNCLLLNENKQIIEALNGNVFLVSGYKIKTPPLSDGCLNGIIRKQIISILAQLPDYILEETSVSPFELQKADEIFITNTIMGIQSVTQYRKKEFSNKIAKDLMGKLNVKARLG